MTAVIGVLLSGCMSAMTVLRDGERGGLNVVLGGPGDVASVWAFAKATDREGGFVLQGALFVLLIDMLVFVSVGRPASYAAAPSGAGTAYASGDWRVCTVDACSWLTDERRVQPGRATTGGAAQ